MSEAAPRSRAAMAATLLPWLLAIASFGNSVYGWIRADATGAADSRYASRHQQEFETSVDQRLNSAVARMDATDRDRDTRTLTMNSRVDGLAVTLHGRIDELTRRFQERSEQRTGELNNITQRLNGLEIKLCVLSGLKVSACK